MSYATCPNCGSTQGSVASLELPTACPDCCARLQHGAALSGPRAPAPDPSLLDVSIPTGTNAPHLARREFEGFARRLGSDVATTGALLISELVTNAVLHGPANRSAAIGLHCAIARKSLHVEVADEGQGFAAHPDRREESGRPGGRGLEIVEALAQAWGVDRGSPTRVWFELAI